MADEYNTLNSFSFDKTQTYNKVVFGAQDGAKKETLIDMSHEGDTPESKSDVAVGLLDGTYILSKDVKAQTAGAENRAWGSNGKLITGTCDFNACVNGDSIRENMAVAGKTFHYTDSPAATYDVHTGTIPDHRGDVGGDGSEGTTTEFLLQPFQEIMSGSTVQWKNPEYIVSSDTTSASSTDGYIAHGVIGTNAEDDTKVTKIKIDFTKDDTTSWLSYVSNHVSIFGVDGQLSHDLEELRIADYNLLDEQTIRPSSTQYIGMKEVKVPDMEITYAEDTTLTGCYACYLGRYGE